MWQRWQSLRDKEEPQVFKCRAGCDKEGSPAPAGPWLGHATPQPLVVVARKHPLTMHGEGIGQLGNDILPQIARLKLWDLQPPMGMGSCKQRGGCIKADAY
jgi:hypothetical protein